MSGLNLTTDDPWLTCVWREFLAGRFTLRQLRVLVRLYAFRAAERFPSASQLAVLADCNTRIVYSALSRARFRGLISRRAEQPSGRTGGRIYRFHLPAELPQ
jgi:hypothetical protein